PISFAAGDANLYRDVGNDPVGMTDPSGVDGSAPRCEGKKKKKRIPYLPPMVGIKTPVNDGDTAPDNVSGPKVAWTDKKGGPHGGYFVPLPSGVPNPDIRPSTPVDPNYNPLYHPTTSTGEQPSSGPADTTDIFGFPFANPDWSAFGRSLGASVTSIVEAAINT